MTRTKAEAFGTVVDWLAIPEEAAYVRRGNATERTTRVLYQGLDVIAELLRPSPVAEVEASAWELHT